MNVLLLTVLFSSCSLLNSGTATIKLSETRATFSGRSYRNREMLSDLSLSVRNIQHPNGFKKWDTNLRFSPSIHFDKTELFTEERLQLPSGEFTDFPDITIERASAFINLKLTAHMPIGQFVATAGKGIAGFRARDGESLNTKRTREITKFEVVYVGFLSRRFFILTGPRYYNDGNEQFVWAFRFGYFWGNIKN